MKATVSRAQAFVQSQQANIYSLFQSAVPPKKLRELDESDGRRQGKFCSWIICWLMVWQKLSAHGSLKDAVQHIRQCCPWYSYSDSTAGISQARERLPLTLARMLIDGMLNFLIIQIVRHGASLERKTFLIDGTQFQLPHTQAILRRFALPKNQCGRGYWPKMVAAFAIDLASGIPLRPAIGALTGRYALNETTLIRDVFARLVRHSIVIGDRAYGILSVLFWARHYGHDAIVRLTEQRTRKILGNLPKRFTDTGIVWEPSRHDLKANSTIPADTKIPGRLLVVRPAARRGYRTSKTPLYLFTTIMNPPADEILRLYLQRWNIETDFRSIKQAFGMECLSSKTPDMLEKEILFGIGAYALVRALMYLAAERRGLAPRKFSFAASLALVRAYLFMFASPQFTEEFKETLALQLLDALATCLLQRRRSPRPPEPRIVRCRPRAGFPIYRGSRNVYINK